MERESTPHDLREGVRSGILSAIGQDADLRGGRTARLLAAAGALGVFGAIGVTLLLSGHPYGHHPASHVVIFTAIWSGLLVVSLALAFLQVRTPTLPLARSAGVGLLGLGLAGLCGALCPDPHFLQWWGSTEVGGRLSALGGTALSVVCFGFATSLCIGAVASVLALGGARRGPIRPLLPAAALLLLLAPGIALQSFGTSSAVFGGWILGTAAGVFAGVMAGMRARAWIGAA